MHFPEPYRHKPTEIPSKRNIIRVIGDGTITVKPNQAEVTLGVTTDNKDLQIAQQNNAVLIDKIIKSIIDLGIPEDQIRTVRYSAQPQYDFIEGKQVFRGYQVEHLLKITINDINNVGTIVDTAVKNGANTVSNISFTISDRNYYERQALSSAVFDAYQKAEIIANTLRVHITGPKLISENTVQQGGPVPFQSTAFLKSEATTPIQAGSMHITSQITAEFEYSPNNS